MAVLDFFNNIYFQNLAIINDNTVNVLAIIKDNDEIAINLNYVIGGLIVIIVILMGKLLFGKK